MDGGSGGAYRVEAERWLTISEKLLTARDFQGAKSFAIRARETDPRLVEFADQIISVADTLLAGELRVINYSTGSNYHDYYAILQLPRLSQSMELVAAQYRKLALLLNPTRNSLSFADHAFRLVSEAWLVFSDPSKKGLYDHELQLSQLGHLGESIQPQVGQQISFSQDYQHYQQEEQQQHQEEVNVSLAELSQPTTSTQPKMTEPIRPIAQHKAAQEPSRSVVLAQPVVNRPIAMSTSGASKSTRPLTKQKRHGSAPANNSVPESSSARVTSYQTDPDAKSFWTACPYCFILYEYPKGYEECAIRCQKCKRAFHAAVIPSPPITNKDTYFCSWGCFPLGCSVRRSGYKVVYKDDDVIDLSDSSGDGSDSDVDWRNNYTKKKNVKCGRGRSTAPGNGSGNNVKRAQNERVEKQMIQNGDDTSVVVAGGQSNVQGEVSRGRKRRANDLGKLDLNVMFSNEVEEAVPSMSEGNGAGTGPEFFDGLDEFFSNLPILSVVGDDKVKPG